MIDATLHALVAIRTLIADPEDWTLGAWSRDESGCIVSTGSPVACRFCVEGARFFVCVDFNDDAVEEVQDTITDASKALYGANEVVVNDKLGHTAIMRVLDHAIATREAA